MLSVFADATQSGRLNLGDCKCGGEIVAGPMRNEQCIFYVKRIVPGPFNFPKQTYSRKQQSDYKVYLRTF